LLILLAEVPYQRPYRSPNGLGSILKIQTDFSLNNMDMNLSMFFLLKIFLSHALFHQGIKLNIRPIGSVLVPTTYTLIFLLIQSVPSIPVSSDGAK